MDRYSNEFKALVTKKGKENQKYQADSQNLRCSIQHSEEMDVFGCSSSAWTPYKVAWSTLQAASTGTGRDQKTAASWPIFP